MTEINQIPNGDIKKDLNFLLDTSYSLMQKLRELCPGTYKHSQAVSSMMETISIDLGLDVTLMKIAAMYHDIGKTFNPLYFTENQIENENPHDDLEPYISYQIITRHVSDSALILLNDKNFPRELIEIITQHHGTSIVRYFFDKSNSDIDEAYRYKSSTPKCVESASLMICDVVEATSRSKIQSGSFEPALIIDESINYLMSDGQLNDVVMRLGDLQKIKEALAKELQGAYQKRVDYTKTKEIKSDKRKEETGGEKS